MTSKVSSPFMAKSPLKVDPFAKPKKKEETDASKYARTVQLAQSQKADKAQVSAKLRDTHPEVESNEVEVTISPDGQKVKAYK